MSDDAGKMNIDTVTQVSFKRFFFFMRFIADNNLWDEVEMHLEDHGCFEIVLSSEPIESIKQLIRQKVEDGEPVSKHGHRIMASQCGRPRPSR
jgi:hypothetical protein